MRSQISAELLDAVADTLIPPGGQWPAPSALGLATDLTARLRVVERRVLASTLADIGDDFLELRAAERTSRLRVYETAEPLKFEQLRRMVYFGYYAQPAVVREWQRQGHDLNESPQPQGYRMDTFRIEQVAAVSRNRRVFIPADRVGTILETAS